MLLNKNNSSSVFKGKYIIAGIKVGMILRKGMRTEVQARPYLCEFEGTPDIVVGIDDNAVMEKHLQNPHLSIEDCEYIWTGSQFFDKLISYNGFVLHSSGVVYKDRAYLFSAPSGTGKSTHTSLWLKVFGEDAYIINDDKPVIRLAEERILVYGTPWSGKFDMSRNTAALLQGICFLERSSKTWIEPINSKEAAFRVLNQTIRPREQVNMAKLLEVMDKVLENTKVFRMGCDISEESVRTAFEAMKDEK
jgi:hypothetical protein